MPKYRKKPVVIEAIELGAMNPKPIWFEDLIRVGSAFRTSDTWTIRQEDHGVRAKVGDYLIKDENGKFSSCKPDIFEATYELAEGEE